MASPRAAVAASPTIRLKNTAPMIFQERSASQRTIRTPRQRRPGVAQGAVLYDRELVVVHRHRTGKLHGSAVFAPEIEIGRRATNSLGRLVPGLQI